MSSSSDIDYEALALGESGEPFEVDTSGEVRAVVVALARAAHRTVDIISRQLDPAVFDNSDVTDALRGFVLRSRRARLRMVIMDSAAVARRGHRLIDLVQRLPTYIEVRGPAREHRAFNQAFVVADGVGYVHQILANRYEARVDFGDRRHAESLQREFDEIWESAQPDPQVRRLSL